MFGYSRIWRPLSVCFHPLSGRWVCYINMVSEITHWLNSSPSLPIVLKGLFEGRYIPHRSSWWSHHPHYLPESIWRRHSRFPFRPYFSCQTQTRNIQWFGAPGVILFQRVNRYLDFFFVLSHSFSVVLPIDEAALDSLHPVRAQHSCILRISWIISEFSSTIPYPLRVAFRVTAIEIT